MYPKPSGFGAYAKRRSPLQESMRAIRWI
jgi:hypothetical protein